MKGKVEWGRGKIMAVNTGAVTNGDASGESRRERITVNPSPLQRRTTPTRRSGRTTQYAPPPKVVSMSRRVRAKTTTHPPSTLSNVPHVSERLRYSTFFFPFHSRFRVLPVFLTLHIESRHPPKKSARGSRACFAQKRSPLSPYAQLLSHYLGRGCS